MKVVRVDKSVVGPSQPTFVVAEMSANHRQSFEVAIQILREMKKAGADAVKLQTYTPDTITFRSSRSEFLIADGSLWAGMTLYDLYKQAYTPWEWHGPLKEEAERLGLIFFSTPFDFTAVDFLENLGVALYKIASFELVDIPLIRRVARTGKPIIMSTGMATLDEITEAVEAARAEGNDQIVLLKCNSAYPAPPEEMNLRTIPDMIERFGVPVGLSDHTLGIAAAVAAVALGACVLEKHFTLRRVDGGPDAAFSLEPHEFAEMVRAVREAERALGRVNYEVTPREAASRVFRRSLFVVEDMRAGDVFTERNVRSIRPGYGLPPKHLPEVLGRRASRDIERGTPLSWDLVGPSC